MSFMHNTLGQAKTVTCQNLPESNPLKTRNKKRSVILQSTGSRDGEGNSQSNGLEPILISPDSATAASPSPEQISSASDRKIADKVFNSCLLIACFGFAAYSVFNVDYGMTRGWSVAEKAMRIPLDNWSSYEASLNAQPVITKTVINVIIYSLGDWLSQTLFVGEDLLEFDARRTMRNGFIGLCFGPLVHEYYEFSDSILPVEVGFNPLYKILMDQTIYISVKCSIYIVAVNVLSGESLEYAIENVRTKIKDVMFTAWKFWPLVHCVTYGVIPARRRILWVNCIDLIWNAILALKTSGDEAMSVARGDDGDNLVTVDGTEVRGTSQMLTGEVSLSIVDFDTVSINTSNMDSDNEKLLVANATEDID